ncbi:MAG: RagB/SusD family nutrient uptake outer membrane protein, partial [Bacteroidales bacterium]
HVLSNADTELLYKGRDSREFVMDKVLEDLNFAAAHCSKLPAYVKSSTRITRWAALALKARVCLFEGTYRKYHTELGLTSSADKFLQEAVSACEDLMANSPYKISVSGDVNTQYRNLFTQESPVEEEVILACKMKKDMRMHEMTWKIFSASYGNNWSLTKQFVNTYLMADGTRFTDKPEYETMLYKDEFKNRDNRLKQTVISPEYKRIINGVLKPDAANFTMTSTGYQMIKWALDDNAFEGKANSYNSVSVFRFAEVLLNYAEAKAELGAFDEAVWDKTIKPLRERAGVKSVVPDTYDPYLAAYFDNQTTDKWILEIRRERGIEMAFENVRYDDIMRWKLGHLIERVWQGMYVPAKNVPMDLNGDGINDVIVMDPGFQSPDKNAKQVIIGSAFRLSEGDRGYIEFGFSVGRKWDQKKYLRPIPKYAIDQNENLLPQNPGWD